MCTRTNSSIGQACTLPVDGESGKPPEPARPRLSGMLRERTRPRLTACTQEREPCFNISLPSSRICEITSIKGHAQSHADSPYSRQRIRAFVSILRSNSHLHAARGAAAAAHGAEHADGGGGARTQDMSASHVCLQITLTSMPRGEPRRLMGRNTPTAGAARRSRGGESPAAAARDSRSSVLGLSARNTSVPST